MPLYKYRPIKQWGRYNTKMFARIDHYQRRRSLPPFRIPDSLKHVPLSEPPGREQRAQQSSVAAHPALAGPPITENPDYHEKPCLLYDGTEPLSEAMQQAQKLCRAIVLSHLPPTLTSLASRVKLERSQLENQLAESCMRAYTWDGTVERLPRRHDPELFWFTHKRVYGIPQHRKNWLLLTDLYNRCVALLAAHKDLRLDAHVLSQRLVHDSLYSVCLPPAAHGDGLGADFVIRHTCPLSIVCSRPLAPVADERQVRETDGIALPDIAPVHRSIDLKREHVYSENGEYPLSCTLSSPLREVATERLYSHTALSSFDSSVPLVQKYPWAVEQLQADALLKAYGACAAMAHRLRPSDERLGDLQRPIVTQHVQLRDGHLNLVVFQLNTLRNDLGDKGVKNIAWIKSARLFSPPPYWEPMEEVRDLDLEAFQAFLALVVNGCDVDLD